MTPLLPQLLNATKINALHQNCNEAESAKLSASLLLTRLFKFDFLRKMIKIQMMNYHSAKIIILILLLGVLNGSCVMTKIDVNDIPVPANAALGNKYPEFGTQMHNSINASAELISDKIGKHDEKLFTLTSSTTWQELARFYDEELSKKGLTRKNDAVIESGEDKLLIYEQQSFFGKKGVAVLLIETVNYNSQEKYYFLTLSASQK